MRKTVHKLDLPLALDKKSPVPLYIQIRDQIMEAAACKRLRPGMTLPSTRELARTLGVSRIVAIAAYEELSARGYIISRQGSGTTVAALPDMQSPPPRKRQPNKPGGVSKISFEPGYPDASLIKPQAWKKIWRHMAADAVENYHAGRRGDPLLREVLSEYIARTRGFTPGMENILITSGTFQALDLTALAFKKHGKIGLENPGYRCARTIFSDRGFTLVPLPVGLNGLDMRKIQTKTLPLIYVTPSHQYPLGATMPVAERLKLLQWARSNDAYIIEDDFDSEFRYDIAPVPALKSLDSHDRVIYIGTFSKIVSADLRLGYIVLPEKLLPDFRKLQAQGYDSAPSPVQRALYHMIRLGELEKHVRRMRLVYARRREALQKAFEDLPPGFRLVGAQAGLHVVLLCPPRVDVKQIVQSCADRQIKIFDLAEYYIAKPSLNGLVIGYGHLNEREIFQGAQAIARVCKRLKF